MRWKIESCLVYWQKFSFTSKKGRHLASFTCMSKFCEMTRRAGSVLLMATYTCRCVCIAVYFHYCQCLNNTECQFIDTFDQSFMISDSLQQCAVPAVDTLLE